MKANKTFKETIKIILIIIVVLLLSLKIFLFCFSRYIQISLVTAANHNSNSIIESKNNKYFIGYYKPLKKFIILNETTIKTEKMWYEKAWTVKSNFWNFGSDEKITREGFNYIIPFDTTYSKQGNFDVCIKEKDMNDYFCLNYRDGYYATKVDKIIDTIEILYSKRGEITYYDTIRYVREH